MRALVNWHGDFDLLVVSVIPWDRRPQQGFLCPHPSIHRDTPSLLYMCHTRSGARVRESSCLCPHGNAEFSPTPAWL